MDAFTGAVLLTATWLPYASVRSAGRIAWPILIVAGAWTLVGPLSLALP
ncbi:MAG: hypothetical protein R3F59_27800 [Myxococcota bacterium]